MLPATFAAGDGGPSWDLANPDLRLDAGDDNYFIDVGVAFDVTTDTVATALGIDSAFDLPSEVTVEIREVSGVTPGAVPLASSSLAVDAGGFAFRDVPISFEFLAGHRYDVRFRIPEFWAAHIRENLNWNHPDLDLLRGFTSGPFLVLDGGGGLGDYRYDTFLGLAHIRVVGAAQDTDPPAVDVRVSPVQHPAGDWYNAESSGIDGVTVEVNATDDSSLAWVRCDDNGRTVLDTTHTVDSFVLADDVHSVSCTARDVNGNLGMSDVLEVRVDQHPPVLKPRVTPNPVVEGQEAAAVAAAEDQFAVVESCDSVSTREPGRHEVGCRAEDLAGNVATATAAYDVLYAYQGFFSPVRMDVVNRAKAGSAVPLKFSLGGDEGLDVLADGSPEVRKCGGGAPSVAEGKLSYDSDTQQYTFVWKTDKAWRDCREITVRLDDGSGKTVDFSFT